jgi:hypothetical protein
MRLVGNGHPTTDEPAQTGDLIMALKNKRPAERGDYGTPVSTRDTGLADALLRSIQVEFADVDYFTREDLLHLPVFSYVATITRYSYVCAAVKVLIMRGKLIAKSQTELVVHGKSSKWHAIKWQVDEFGEKLTPMVVEILKQGDGVTVMNVVDRWTGDRNLSQNIKRVIVRGVMTRLVAEGLLIRSSLGVFTAVPGELHEE